MVLQVPPVPQVNSRSSSNPWLLKFQEFLQVAEVPLVPKLPAVPVVLQVPAVQIPGSDPKVPGVPAGC